MKNDLLIQRDVVAALALNSALGADAIGVEVHHGFVKLAGHVRTNADRMKAAYMTKRVSGVTDVALDIDVLPTRKISCANQMGLNESFNARFSDSVVM